MAWTFVDNRSESESEPRGIRAICIQCWGMLGREPHLLSGWRGEIRLPIVDDGRPGEIRMGVCVGCAAGLSTLLEIQGDTKPGPG